MSPVYPPVYLPVYLKENAMRGTSVLVALLLSVGLATTALANGHEDFLPPPNISVDDVAVPESIEPVCAEVYIDAFVAVANYIREVWEGAILTQFQQFDIPSLGFWTGLERGITIMIFINENRTRRVPIETFPFSRRCTEEFDQGWGDGWNANEHILSSQ